MADSSARRVLAAVIALAMVFSTLTEVIVPVFAGHLVDALAQGPAALYRALDAFAAMIGLALLMLVLRQVAWSGIVRLTLSIMSNSVSV